MKHPYYPLADKFKPSADAINSWLKTRKNRKSNKPGIFETVDYNRDRNWSIASILIEIAAFYFTFQGAYSTYIATGSINVIFYAIVVVLLFIIFDIFGIMLHGQDKPERTKKRSEYLITGDENKRLEIYNSLKEISWREFLGFMLLIISAMMKIFALYFFLHLINLQVFVIFTILYTLVIYIHSAHTVYWWPAFKLNLTIKKQAAKFEEYHGAGLPTEPGNTVTQTDNYTFQSKGKITGGKTIIDRSNNSRVTLNLNTDGTYTLKSTGLLWDEEIVQLAQEWEPEYIQDLINACIYLQLLQLQNIASLTNGGFNQTIPQNNL